MDIPQRILQVLLLDNAWLENTPLKDWFAHHLPGKFIPRDVVLEGGSMINLVIGPRQAGKSTFIWHTLAEKKQPCLLINCEEPAMREWMASPSVFLAGIKSLTGNKKAALFFEEIQHHKNAGLFLKGLADRKPNVEIYAAGNSAFHLNDAVRESLAGRAIRYTLLPFSMSELSDNIKRNAAIKKKKQIELLEKLLIFGGYPQVHATRSQSPEKLLTRLVESYVLRDASDRFKIKNTSGFRKLLELIASQIGSLSNYSKWASISSMSSPTVLEYITVLEDSHIVYLARPFVGNKRAEITSRPKVYFIDNGIKNRIFGGFAPFKTRPDKGALLEQFIFSELCKYTNPLIDDIRYWRSKSGAEVDFVLSKNGKIYAFEVKAGDVRGNISRSSRSFIKAYSPVVFFIICKNKFSDSKIDKTIIKFINPMDLQTQLADCNLK